MGREKRKMNSPFSGVGFPLARVGSEMSTCSVTSGPAESGGEIGGDRAPKREIPGGGRGEWQANGEPGERGVDAGILAAVAVSTAFCWAGPGGAAFSAAGHPGSTMWEVGLPEGRTIEPGRACARFGGFPGAEGNRRAAEKNRTSVVEMESSSPGAGPRTRTRDRERRLRKANALRALSPGWREREGEHRARRTATPCWLSGRARRPGRRDVGPLRRSAVLMEVSD